MLAHRRLRGKQARPSSWLPCEEFSFQLLHHLFQLAELVPVVTSWLDQRSLCRLGVSNAFSAAIATCPEAWSGRVLVLKSRSIKNSAQLIKVLEACARRWTGVQSMVFPQMSPSAVAVRSVRAALPALRSIDLNVCPEPGTVRLLAGLPAIEEVVGVFVPRAPLLKLRHLDLCGGSGGGMNAMHWQDSEDSDLWASLPRLVPNLELLRAPWSENDGGKEVDQECWDFLHQPPLGCTTSDACLRHLQDLKCLREVDLSDVYTITDASLRTLANLPKLERLSLQNMGPRVTADGLRHLADGCAPLCFLDLRRCLDIGRRPSTGRTSFVLADILAFRRRRPRTEVLFS